MKPLISVIIPVFHVEHYIVRCLKSVQQQKFASLEVILVDDCGNDNSIPTARKFIGGDSRFRIVRNKKNLGLGPARDRGVKEARGEYILFLDADDYLTDDALETLCDAVLQDEADITVFQARHLHRFSQRIYPEFPDRINGSGRDFLPAFLMTRTPHPIFPNVENYEWNKLIRRNLIIRNEIRHLPDPLLGEDFYFTTQLLMYADKVVCLPKTLYCYERRNAGSLTARSDLRFFATCFRPIVEVRNFLQQHGAWTQELETRFYMHIYRYFYFEILNRLSFFSVSQSRICTADMSSTFVPSSSSLTWYRASVSSAIFLCAGYFGSLPSNSCGSTEKLRGTSANFPFCEILILTAQLPSFRGLSASMITDIFMAKIVKFL